MKKYLALGAAVALIGCSDPLPAVQIDGCFLHVGDLSADLGQVVGFNWSGDFVTVLFQGNWEYERINPRDRKEIEAAWRRCVTARMEDLNDGS